MSMFPLFIDLRARKCVVVGGGKIAARKIETLIDFNAEIVVISPEIIDEILELKQNGVLTHLEKTYSEGDLEGAFLVIAATSDRAVNDRIAEEAGEKNIFVNVADDAERCTFIFPSVVKKNELIIGIITSGSYPALSKSIRKKIENMLVNLDDGATDMLRKCRERASVEIKNAEIRTELLNRILEEAIFCDKKLNGQQIIERIFCEVEDDEKIDLGWSKGEQTSNSPEYLGYQ
ncbi:MAG: precorrin-2 dehydrogenase/sirohydrochlorin ferrochelatase family protein [Clostridia bacterium]